MKRTGRSPSAARPSRKYRVVPELPTDTSSLCGAKLPAPPATRQPSPADPILTPNPRSAWTVKVTWRAALRCVIVLSPSASAASISARWAWYLDGGIVSSPTSGTWALATSRRTGGRITVALAATGAGRDRTAEWGVVPGKDPTAPTELHECYISYMTSAAVL